MGVEKCSFQTYRGQQLRDPMQRIQSYREQSRRGEAMVPGKVWPWLLPAEDTMETRTRLRTKCSLPIQSLSFLRTKTKLGMTLAPLCPTKLMTTGKRSRKHNKPKKSAHTKTDQVAEGCVIMIREAFSNTPRPQMAKRTKRARLPVDCRRDIFSNARLPLWLLSASSLGPS